MCIQIFKEIFVNGRHLIAKLKFSSLFLGVFIILLNACSGELKFSEAKDILSKQLGTIKIFIPSTESRFIKYVDDKDTIFDKLAAEGYVEIIQESERPSNSKYDQRIYYRVKFTEKLRPYLAGQSFLKVGDIEVADIVGIKKVPVDESLRIVEFTTRFVPNAIGKIIALKNKNNQIEQTSCLIEKHYIGWRLSLMPPDFVSMTETISPAITPIQLAEKILSPSVKRQTVQASSGSTVSKAAKESDLSPNPSKDISLQPKDLSIEDVERICHNAVLSMAVPVQTATGTISYYVETADRTNILPYKDKFKRYGHRFCFSVRIVPPDGTMGLLRSVMCSIYKDSNEWKYELASEGCS